MKVKSIYIQCIIVAMGLTFFSCNDYDWDVDHSTTLTAIQEVSCSMPDVLMSINYRDSLEDSGTHLKKGKTVHFEWSKVSAADYSKVFYEIQFFKASNLEKPFYSYETTSNQIDNFADITEFEINDIAERGEILQNGEATLKWRVRASNGVVETFSPVYDMKIKRPAGFARYPSAIYFLGSAVEGVDDVVYYAPRMRNLKKLVMNGTTKEYRETGEYNTFSYLQDGEFYFLEKLSGDTIYRRFTLSENNDIVEVFGGQAIQQVKTIKNNAIHKVQLNFKTGKGTVTAIDNVELWYNGSVNGSLGSLTLADAKTPVWTLTHYLELSGTTISKFRYKFRMLETDRSGTSTYNYWGYESVNAVNQATNSPASYFYLYPTDDTTSNCFKFQESGHDKKTLEFTLDMRTLTDYYTHSIKEVKTN